MKATDKPAGPWLRMDLPAYLRRRQRAHLLIASALDVPPEGRSDGPGFRAQPGTGRVAPEQRQHP